LALGRFELSLIARYFPEYAKEIRRQQRNKGAG
jgi:hypothetical protein